MQRKPLKNQEIETSRRNSPRDAECAEIPTSGTKAPRHA
jgi:hypothetical protein